MVCVQSCARDQFFVPDSEDSNNGECIRAVSCPDGKFVDKNRRGVSNCSFFTKVGELLTCYDSCPPEYPREVASAGTDATVK